MGVGTPASDVEFLQNMIKYQEEDDIVANAAFKKLSSHRWHFTETAVAFLLFSNHSMMIVKVKESMVLRLLSTLLYLPMSFVVVYLNLEQSLMQVDA